MPEVLARTRLRRPHRQVPEVARLVLPELAADAEVVWEDRMKYKIGSLFDGSGGFPLAGTLCGIEPIWASEVEPYPIAVTRSRFPNMKHLGSVTNVHGGEIEPVDIITFGSPCQDLSVAGKRAGLKHADNGDDETTRSGLFMEAVRIIKEMREATNGEYPAFALWENVPGAFSSNKGEDFRTVLEELIKIVEPTAVMPAVPKNGWAYADSYIGDRWSLAYRVLDAQYWGVPQRRRRIYLVLDLRGQRAREVLFEREGLRRDFTKSGTPWQGTAADAERGAGAADCEGECVAYSFDSLASNSMKSKNPYSGCRRVEIAKTLDTTDPNPCKNQGGIAIVEPVPYTLKIRSGCEGGGKGALIQEDKSATLATNNDQGGQQISVRSDGKAPTLRAETHGNLPCVLEAAGFKAGQSMAGGIGWQEECAATLAAQCSGTEPTVCVKNAYSIENHPADSRVNIDDSGKVQTLTSRMGTGGGNVPMVLEQKACSTDVGFFNSYEERSPTLLARMYKDPHLVAYPESVRYIVRRLTPTECARLQGFADRWGDIEEKKDFTPEEADFWATVRNTHATINGKPVQPYTKAQMLTWYNKLHTDSSEYKMWGNGIALPTALYVMQGIFDAMERNDHG